MSAAASAQVVTPTPIQVQKPDMKLTDLPPEVRLGVRAEVARQKLPAARTVVITPDPGAYLDALDRWTLESRFPVLIDDGSDESRERIARFVRAYQPEEVLRWSGDGVHNLTKPTPITERAAAIDDVAAGAWNAPNRAALFETWLAQGFAPPGVVVASLRDRAWPAAAALAAGHGQPILWLDETPPGRIGSVMEVADFQTFDQTLADKLDELGIAWRASGDVIDSVTLCLNMPTKVPGADGNPDEPLSLTDRIGRHADASRWAWTGIIFGDESESAWRAMCALFLQPERVWFFDGYRGRDGMFQGYDVVAGANTFAERGYEVTVDNRAGAGIDAWQARARLGVLAGFIHVNSSGTRRRFTLTPGRPYASDIPLLWTPAVVHFIHSFSAQNLDDRRSIARLWLDRGAYAYVGSVHEPYLQGFQTPEAVSQRLFAPAPFGVAATKDMGRPWRLLVIGDPLITFGPQAPTAEMPELPGAESVETSMKRALRERDLAAGLGELIVLGRDADAARLVRAVVDDDPARLTPEVARVGWRALLRTGQVETMMQLIEAMHEKDRQNDELIDMVWLALRPALASGDVEAIRMLQTRLRSESFGDDAIDLAEAIHRAQGDAAARAWLSAMRNQAPSERTREQIEEALGR